jgi:hypothetical protein
MVRKRQPLALAGCQARIARIIPEIVVVQAERDVLYETASLYDFSLCSSRACLGKMLVFSINGAKDAFSYLEEDRSPLGFCPCPGHGGVLELLAE